MDKKGNLEWKLKRKCDKLCCKRNTYEELKHVSILPPTVFIASKRNTYEELKPERSFCN